MRHWVCVCTLVCAQRSCPSRLLWSVSFLRTGIARAHALRPRDGFPPGPRSYSRRLTPGLDGRGGGGKQKGPRRCGHTRAVSTCTVVFACCACDTGARETLGVCVHACVCAAVVSVSSAVVCFFFADGDSACSRSQTRDGFPPGPHSSLRESLRTHSVRTLPSSTGVG